MLVWAKEGYRNSYYARMKWADSGVLPSEKTSVEVDAEVIREQKRLDSAKCHALIAYKSALVVVNGKYERDADVYNQEASFDAKDGELPDFVRPRHAYKGSTDQQIMTIINNFPGYFPKLARRYADDTNDRTTSIYCLCCDDIGEDGKWRPRVPSMTQRILADDNCGPYPTAHESVMSLMHHLYTHDTPLHSAGFAYNAYMAADRLPAFKYSYSIHGDEGTTTCGCPARTGACLMEVFSNKVKAFKEMRDRGKESIRRREEKKERGMTAFERRVRGKYESMGEVPDGFVCQVLNSEYGAGL